MPRIQEYESKVAAPGPLNMPKQSIEEAASIGKGIQTMGAAVMSAGEKIEQRQEQHEISDLSAKLSEFHAQKTNEWQETLKTADPNDTELASKFQDKLREDLSKLQEGASTSGAQDYFKRSSADLDSHFLMTTVAGQSQLAGVKAKEDFQKGLASSSAALMDDPSSFGVTLKLQNDSLDAKVAAGLLPREVAEQLRPETNKALAKSAVRGWVDLNPEEAKQQLKSGQWDEHLDGDTKKQLEGEADQAIRAKETEAERQRQNQERIKKDQQEKTQQDLLGKMVDGSLTMKDVMKSNLEAFGSGSKDTFVKMLEADTKEGGIKTDKTVWIDTFKRIHADEGDPNKVTDEEYLNNLTAGGKLSFEDNIKLRAEMQGRKSADGAAFADMQKQFLQMAEHQITQSNPMLGKMDQDGDNRYYQFTVEVQKAVEQYRKAGKNPRELFDPHNPEYVGKYIGHYQKTNEQIIKDLTKKTLGLAAPLQSPFAGIGPSPTPMQTAPTSTPAPTPPPITPDRARKPGESAAAYLKRMKEK